MKSSGKGSDLGDSCARDNGVSGVIRTCALWGYNARRHVLAIGWHCVRHGRDYDIQATRMVSTFPGLTVLHAMWNNAFMAERHEDADIIDALGGIAETARAFNTTYRAVHNWTRRGVPKEYEFRVRFARYAAEKNVALPADRFPSFGAAA